MTTSNTYNAICNIIDPIYTTKVNDHKKGYTVDFDRDATTNGNHALVAKELAAHGFIVKLSERTGRAKHNQGTVYGRVLIIAL